MPRKTEEWRNNIFRNFIVCITRSYSGDPIKEVEMGSMWSTHGVDEKCVQNFSVKPKWRKPFESLGLCGKVILSWLLGKDHVAQVECNISLL